MSKSIVLASCLMALAAPVAMAEMKSPTSTRHILNLDDVEINDLIEDVSIVTGYTFVVHPDVRSKRVTVMSQTPMSAGDVFQVFLSTLRVHGFAAIPSGRDTFKIVPEQMAVGEARIGGSGPNAFVTQIIKLNNFSAVDAAQMVKPLIDAQGQVVANAKSNTLVVVDYTSNMAKINALLQDLDTDHSRTETIALKNVPAREIAAILMDLHGPRDSGALAVKFTAVASETSNSIIIRGDDLTIAQALSVATQLDQTDPVRDNLRVITLRNSDARDIVPILEKVGDTMYGQKAVSEGQGAKPSITHHEPTNSLIISADYETLRAMERIVDALDVRRTQVLVEAIIVEMTDDTARELGVQFLLAGSGGDTPFVSTNFSRSAPNLLALTGALVGDGLLDNGGTGSTGVNPFQDAAVSSLLGINGLSLGGGGQSGNTLFGIVLNALESDTESNVLSTPYAIALDNSTAILHVGQEIPITTGEVLGSNNVNPFRTVQRLDVGVKLEVTPHVGDGNTVRLDIFQEVSSIFGAVGPASPDLITNTRTITTTVLADDGDLIVLGGLIQQRETVNSSKVPILGDVPVVGRLFRSEGVGNVQTNLMVFIRPTILRDADDAQAATAQKYRYLRAEDILRNGKDESQLDAFVESVLDTSPPK